MEDKVKSWQLTGDALAAAKELQQLTTAADESIRNIKKLGKEQIAKIETEINAAMQPLLERISFQVGFPVQPDHPSEPHLDLRYLTEHDTAFIYARDLTAEEERPVAAA